MKISNIIAWSLVAVVFAGCERENGAEVNFEAEKPLTFVAGIAGGSSMKVETNTRASAWADGHSDIMAKMNAKRDNLLKKTFNYKDPLDVIRICNVNDRLALPTFDLESDGRVYQYSCRARSDDALKDWPDGEGSDEEDKWVEQGTERSEYVFEPDATEEEDRTYGFYLNDLVSDGENYFTLYAMWWKGFVDEGGRTVKVPESVIASDQSSEEDFLRSDMMLAVRRHTLDMPYAPMRLTFYHSFAMLDVRVVLPVYDPGGKATDAGETEDRLPSGYMMDGVSMEMTNVFRTYEIPHSSAPTSNTKLMVRMDPNAEGAEAEDIKMHRYFVEDDDKTWTNDTKPGHLETDASDSDKKSLYRTYGFCGILPSVTWNQEHATGPLLRLHVTDPVTKEPREYTYTPKMNTGSTDSTGDLVLEPGQISVLILRLSRTAQEMQLVEGTVVDWTNAETDVIVAEETGPVTPPDE